AGPVAMGTCRFLNVLLGFVLIPEWTWPWSLHLALVVGLYIVGVTWFARTEAQRSDPLSLKLAALTMLAALVLALSIPTWFPPGTSSPLFPYLLVVFGFYLGVPIYRATVDPSAKKVQSAVKRCILGLVLLDAVLATAIVGTWGLVILLLLPPAWLLSRSQWLYAT
ncbi:MAG: hypothetical protein ACK4RK_18145, partial [Gemmataceae bacterium]